MTDNTKRPDRRRDYGDGSLEERSPGRWRLRWRVGSHRYNKAFNGSKRAAQTELRRLLKTADDVQHVAPDRITVDAWAEQWFALLARREGEDTGNRKRGLVSPRTLERYRDLFRVHILPALGSRRLQQVTPTEIDTLYLRLEARLSPNTVRFIHAVLGSCFNAAVRKGLMIASPVVRAEPPPSDNSTVGRVLDQDELGSLLSGFRRYALYPIVAAAAFTGARRNELLALRWCDLDLAAKTLTIRRALETTKAHGFRYKEPKTNRGVRTIAIDDNLTALLAAEREKHLRLIAGVGQGLDVDLSLVKLPEDALIFPSFTDDPDLTRPRHPASVTVEFINRARKLGFANLRFHDLRGTHETMLLDAGVPVHVVAARCGHDPAVLLRVYAKRTRKADTSAAAIIGALSQAVLGGTYSGYAI